MARLARSVTLIPCVIAAGCIALIEPASAGATTVAPAATWHRAMPVPGLRKLNTGGRADVLSVSCPSAGNCAVGGYYTASGGAQAFVASQHGGRWGQAMEVPGSGALNAGGNAEVNSLSCGSAGNCVAGGSYLDTSGRHYQAFLVSQKNGTWGKATKVPGTATLNEGGDASVTAVSCTSAGNCAAGGYYTDAFSHDQAFVVTEVNGTWAKAIEVPGSGTLNTYGFARVFSVSCGSAGDCTAGGAYSTIPNQLAFVVSEQNGIWGNAQELQGPADSGAPGPSSVDAVSCPPSGSCAAAGFYSDQSNRFQAYLTNGLNDHWAYAINVPGSEKLNTTGFADVNGVSCPSAGSCAVGGYFRDSSNNFQPLVTTERKGVWGDAIEVPGTAKLNNGDAQILDLSCGSPGNCVAAGFYTDGSGNAQPFVVTEQNGSWGNMRPVIGSTAFPTARADTVSCAPKGNCVAAGWYKDPSHHFQGFVVSRS